MTMTIGGYQQHHTRSWHPQEHHSAHSSLPERRVSIVGSWLAASVGLWICVLLLRLPRCECTWGNYCPDDRTSELQITTDAQPRAILMPNRLILTTFLLANVRKSYPKDTVSSHISSKSHRWRQHRPGSTTYSENTRYQAITVTLCTVPHL